MRPETRFVKCGSEKKLGSHGHSPSMVRTPSEKTTGDLRYKISRTLKWSDDDKKGP